MTLFVLALVGVGCSLALAAVVADEENRRDEYHRRTAMPYRVCLGCKAAFLDKTYEGKADYCQKCLGKEKED